MKLRQFIFVLITSFVLSGLCFAQPVAKVGYKLTQKNAEEVVRTFLKTNKIIDGHNDFYHSFFDCSGCKGDIEDFQLDSITSGTTNIPLFRKGSVAGQLYNIYGKDRKAENLLKAFDLMYLMVKTYPEDITIAATAADLRIALQNKKIALLPILEGAVLLQDSKSLLRMYYKLGLRSVTFAYKTNSLADGSDDTVRHNGISSLGIDMIREMNRLGIIIDMSHISANAMRDILKTTKAPVIFSHSNAYSLCKVNRNVPDDVLLELKKNKGIIMLNFIPFYISQQHADWLSKAENDWKNKVNELKDTAAADKYYSDVWIKQNPEPAVSVSDVADHFDYIKKLIGVDYIGIGSDLGDRYEFTIKGMSDVSCFPTLLIELARRGWTEAELKKITSENFLRVFEDVEKRSSEIKSTANIGIANSGAGH
jgi:membrane dipeptidase